MTRGSLLAVGVSLALHAAALFAVAGRSPAPPVERASLPPPVELEVLRLAAVAPPSRAAPQSSPTPVAALPSVARAAAPARPAAPPAEVAAPLEPADVAVPVEAGAPSAPVVSAAGEAVRATEPAPSGGEAAGDALDTTELSRRLQEGARHCYPKAAERFRQRGTVQVSFCLDGAGALRTPTVAGSSGFALLDTAATSCVVPAAAPFEAPAFGRCFTLAVRF